MAIQRLTPYAAEEGLGLRFRPLLCYVDRVRLSIACPSAVHEVVDRKSGHAENRKTA